MIKKLWRITLLATLLAIGACSGSGSSPGSAPTGFTVTARDGTAIVTWDQQPGLTYYLFRAQATAITPTNYNTFPQALVTYQASSPFVASGLTNGLSYAFTLNATSGSSSAGPATPSIAVIPRLAGAQFTAGNSLGTANHHGVTTALGYVIALGDGGDIQISADGVNWTVEPSGTTNSLYGGVYGSSLTKIVLVGSGGTILSGISLSSWTTATSGTTADLKAVAYGASTYVAVGAGGTILASTDTASWSAKTSGTTQDLYAVTYLNSVFIAVGAGGTILTSSDGNTWTPRASQTTADLHGIAFGNSTYAVVGNGGTIITSTDAATWTTQAAFTTQNLTGVAYGSQFVASGSGGTIIYGTDGKTWANATTGGVTSDLYGIIYGPGIYTAVGQAGVNLSAY